MANHIDYELQKHRDRVCLIHSGSPQHCLAHSTEQTSTECNCSETITTSFQSYTRKVSFQENSECLLLKR